MTARKPKSPPDLPAVNDRARLRGRAPTGVVTFINHETKWVQVRWDNSDGPRYCHWFELERISPSLTAEQRARNMRVAGIH